MLVQVPIIPCMSNILHANNTCRYYDAASTGPVNEIATAAVTPYNTPPNG
jgi:hypothetical protein